MSATFPISLSVEGHPLIESVLVSWSASDNSMIPQVLKFGPEGGISEAIVISEDADSIWIRYHAEVGFTIPDWSIVQTQNAVPLTKGGQQLKLNPGAWLNALSLRLQSAQPEAQTDHLVVNLTWQSEHLTRSIQQSARLTAQTAWDVIYVQDSLRVTVSGFGTLSGQFVRFSTQDIDLTKRSTLLDQNGYQLIAEPKEISACIDPV